MPDYLIYEIMDGKPTYYKGYRDVLNKTKQPEEITGCSNLQWKIISFILCILFTKLEDEKYEIATNEPELHLNTGNNLSGDILVYKKLIFNHPK